MHAEPRPGDGELRQLAREEPEAVRSVAELYDDEFGDWLLRILEEERGEA